LDGGPGVVVPLGNGGFVAPVGTPRGLLRTPADGLAQATDVTRMIRHAECPLNHGSNPRSRPELAPEAVCLGAALEEAGQLSELFGS
jgi:hypothetical protein